MSRRVLGFAFSLCVAGCGGIKSSSSSTFRALSRPRFVVNALTRASLRPGNQVNEDEASQRTPQIQRSLIGR